MAERPGAFGFSYREQIKRGLLGPLVTPEQMSHGGVLPEPPKIEPLSTRETFRGRLVRVDTYYPDFDPSFGGIAHWSDITGRLESRVTTYRMSTPWDEMKVFEGVRPLQLGSIQEDTRPDAKIIPFPQRGNVFTHDHIAVAAGK